MATRESVKRYHLIINRLRRKPSTLVEIKDYLDEESEIRGYDYNISTRTFKRDCENIGVIYGIEIVYDKSQRVYKIDDNIQQEVDSRIMEAFDYIDVFEVSKSITEQVIFENRRPQGTENLYGLIHAIKKKQIIQFKYQKYYETEQTHREVEPLVLKEFKYRWYVLAKDRKDNNIKTFALDRLADLEITQQSFSIPNGFSPNNYFKHSFGIVTEAQQKPQEVILSFSAFQGKYIKSLPFHHSQDILIDNEDELRISLTINITHDFLLEILSYGANVKVLAPNSLISDLKEQYKNALGQYEN
ncbi:MAG: WYL domain-containing protein [Bacteroidales bacterium]|jgi:hypothetical protein|nr:WYL domain-containing protein [Bacteroidales bacterium]